jgi:hypothetical protein
MSSIKQTNKNAHIGVRCVFMIFFDRVCRLVGGNNSMESITCNWLQHHLYTTSTPWKSPWLIDCQMIGRLTGFRLLPQYWGWILGSFFRGVYLPQKSVLLPPIERQYTPFQKHVHSYLVKISESCFVWVAPTLLRGGPYLKIEEQPFEHSQEVRNRTRHV